MCQKLTGSQDKGIILLDENYILYSTWEAEAVNSQVEAGRDNLRGQVLDMEPRNLCSQEDSNR